MFLLFLAIRPADTRGRTEQDAALCENYSKRYLSIDCPRKILTSCQPYRPSAREHLVDRSPCPIYFLVRPSTALTRCDGSFEGAVIDNRPF